MTSSTKEFTIAHLSYQIERNVAIVVLNNLPLAEAADALRYLVEGRPFGRVVLTI